MRARFVGTSEDRSEALKLLSSAGDIAVVRRGGVDRWLVMRCPSNCGDDIILNVDPRAGRAWRIYRRKNGLSIFPSVWRDIGCKSHFIVWRDRILWCGWPEDPLQRVSATIEADRILASYRRHDTFTSFRTVADELDEVPWEVLRVSRLLVRSGVLEESNSQDGFFKPISGGSSG